MTTSGWSLQTGRLDGTLRSHLTRAEVEAIIGRGPSSTAPDHTLADDLAWIGAGSTDELGALQVIRV